MAPVLSERPAVEPRIESDDDGVQPHGLLIVLREPDLTIEAIGENAAALIGISARFLCGQRLSAIMSASDASAFEARLHAPNLLGVNPLAVTLTSPAGREARFECSVHRLEDGDLIVELEPLEASLERPVYTDVQAPIERLQSAPDIAAVVMTAAKDMRALSGFERTLIYRVDDDWQADVVAEATAPGVAKRYAGAHFPAADIPEHLRAPYLRTTLQVVADTHAAPVALVWREGRPRVALRRATLRGASPYSVAYSRNMGSRSTLTISIVVRGRLWGLIVCHDSAPHRLSYARRALCEFFGHMLAWQLGARVEAELRQRGARESTLLADVRASIEAAQDLAPALVACAPQLFELFAADGIAVRIDDTLARSGNVPADDATIAAIVHALTAAGHSGDIVVADHRLRALLPELAGTLPGAGALCARLAGSDDAFLLLFRPEAVRTIHWGGPPPAPAEIDRPRTSFEPWAESIRDQSRPWTAADVDMAKSLATHVLGQLQLLAQSRAERTSQINVSLDERNAQAQALIGLQHDVAAALPSRAAVIDVVLRFALRQTRADGSAFETLTGQEVVFDTTAGSLTSHAGLRFPRAGSLSGMSADLNSELTCDDTSMLAAAADRELCARLNIGSMLVVPISVSPNATFVLKVTSAKRGAFAHDEAQTLKLAATNLLSALGAAQKFTALAAAELEQRTYARQLRALHAIASTTTSRRKEQIDAALQLGLEQLGLNWAFLGVLDYATQELVIENSVSNDGRLVLASATRIPLGETLFARAALSKHVTIVQAVADLSERPRFEGWSSYIAAPLLIGGRPYGVIGFTSREVRAEPFTDANVEFIAVGAELIASAVERGLQRDELERSQQRYRALIEAIPQKMWVVDAANTFEYVNQRWTEYTGLTLDESRAADRANLFRAADMGAIDLNESLPATEADFEVRLRRADGAYHWHLVRCVPFRGPAGNVDKWLVTATDIEARKAAETVLEGIHDAALAATEAKSRFLATMSHEIRTPMNGVIGMTELLLLTPLDDEQREYTEVIRDSGQSLLRVLNDILDYSKIEAGKLGLETVVFDLPGQVESVVELLRPGFTSKGVALTTDIAPDVRTTVLGDPGRLRQILLNLAGNALKFTAPAGSVEITVTTRTGDDNVSPVRFAIKDTGIGIPASVIDRLFQPFSQGDESTTRKYGGTGLGLSISAELVALMNGEIGVESTPGIGSVFWFEIPFRLALNSRRIADTRDPVPKPAAPAALRPERILLVEDNEINTFLALKQLQRLGFAVTAVDNGLQAVETIDRERYDLVLMDCHMPEMDGFEATRAIRKMEAENGLHLPIVAMTADARDEDHQNCLAAGMDDYISKPTNLESLRAVLDRWLPAPERRRASRNGAVPKSSQPVLGFSMLLELFNGDRAAVFELLAAALASIGNDLRRIEAASAAHDFETVIEAAHRLKGTSGSIRAGRLVEIGVAIEAEARTAPVAISLPLLADLRAAVAALTTEVQQQRKNSDAASLR